MDNVGPTKRLMQVKNLVNMDTRTVVSCFPFCCDLMESDKEKIRGFLNDETLFHSVFDSADENEYIAVTSFLKIYRMLTSRSVEFVSLAKLKDWRINKEGITCVSSVDYCVRYYNIDIEGREVKQWIQPMFVATTSATFGLISFVEDGKQKFIVRLRSEVELSGSD